MQNILFKPNKGGIHDQFHEFVIGGNNLNVYRLYDYPSDPLLSTREDRIQQWNVEGDHTKVAQVLTYNNTDKNPDEIANEHDNEIHDENRKFKFIKSYEVPEPIGKMTYLSGGIHESLAYTGTKSGTLYVVDMKNGKLPLACQLKSHRNCFDLAWNATENLIAQGFEKGKYKSYQTLKIWDLSRHSFNVGKSNSVQIHPNHGETVTTVSHTSRGSSVLQLTSTVKDVISVPKFSCENESICSLSWIPNKNKCLIAGVLKHLRIFDFRGTQPKIKSLGKANSSIISSIKFNPFDHSIFAISSESDRSVSIWDMRKLNTSVRNYEKILVQPSPVQSMEWSSVDKDILTIHCSNSNEIRYFDVTSQVSTNTQDPKYRFSSYQSVYLGINSPSNYSLVPNKEHAVIAVGNNELEYVEAIKHPIIDVGSRNFVAIVEDQNTIHVDSTPSEHSISMRMFKLASKGLTMDFNHNYKICKSMKNIPIVNKDLWNWGRRMRVFHKSNAFLIKPRVNMLKYSILDVFKNANLPFELKESRIKELGELKYSIKSYICLHLLGWYDHEFPLLSSSEIEERDIALAIFNLNLDRASELLLQLNNNKYSMFALGLQGYNKKNTPYYKKAAKGLSNAYLKCALEFLALGEFKNQDYNFILKEEQIRLTDRIAFACCYLPEKELLEFIAFQTEYTINKGLLEGILLTGLSQTKGIPLIVNYVDRTTDIQTAALLFTHVTPISYKEKCIERYLFEYRELLDRWRLWNERANLDIRLAQYTQNFISTNTASVNLQCRICGFQLLNNANTTSSMAKPFGGQSYRFAGGINVLKGISCPNCNNDLPKCSICLMPYGAPLSSLGIVEKEMNTLDYCFTWCRTCKHGGHVKHLNDWFKNHDRCPVKECECHCTM
mmetsp:Transcript_8637/g.12754  ORF Transcript_8637/g.12754 Transcript_8637/m.12754 type:complete len:892 (+) Transcript_8637:15-2690(+)